LLWRPSVCENETIAPQLKRIPLGGRADRGKPLRVTAPASIHFGAVTPQFTVPDIVRTVAYYRDVLGFQVAGYWDGERVTDAYFHVTGIDALAVEFRSRGAEILDGPEDRSYGQRELMVRDCNGLILAFAEDTSGRAT
jgi:hypothetical protein